MTDAQKGMRGLHVYAQLLVELTRQGMQNFLVRLQFAEEEAA